MNVNEPLLGEKESLITSKSQVIALFLGASACFIAGNQIINSGSQQTQESDIFELARIVEGQPCAWESGNCQCSGLVYYGKPKSDGLLNERAAYATQWSDAGSIGCNNAVFGDPLPGTPKACYCVEESIPEITAIRFQEDGYIDGGNGNDWHYVWITNPGCDGVNFKWNNKAGVQWSLTPVMDGDQIDYFDVGTDCPYYDSGHTQAQLSYDGDQISAIAGPWNEPYTAHTTFTTQFDFEPQVCEAPKVTDIRFQEDGYIDGGNGNDWHYVWITNPSCDGVNYKWNNKAGVQWSLTAVKSGDKIDYFAVGTDCPYYASGHTVAQLSYDGEDISAIAGPWNEPYTAHLSFTTQFDFEPSTCE